MLPNLWIGGKHQAVGDWISFQKGRETRCVKERLCVVCGEPLGRTLVLGHYENVSRTDGPGGHPRCIWMAVNTCPHFARNYNLTDDRSVVAFAYDGPNSGHSFVTGEFRYEGQTGNCPIVPECKPLSIADLRQLAKQDPLGKEAFNE